MTSAFVETDLAFGKQTKQDERIGLFAAVDRWDNDSSQNPSRFAATDDVHLSVGAGYYLIGFVLNPSLLSNIVEVIVDDGN